MLMALGLSAANSAVLGNRPTKVADTRSERRENNCITYSPRVASRWPRRLRLNSAGEGKQSPRALAAFVKRPQAALLKSAHVYSIWLAKQAVKRMFLLSWRAFSA